ncbi:MAG: glycosyltransferase family 2 protein [Ilyomonas sp.]
MNMIKSNVVKIKRANCINIKFSILIPSWNNLAYLKLCINSILKNSIYNHQILVHINEGSDGTKEWIEQQTNIDFTYTDKNIGVCYALNSLRTLAEADYIVYLNDDMYVCPQWDAFLLNEVKLIGHKLFFLSATAIEPKKQSICSIEKNYGISIDHFDEERLLKEYASLPFADWQGATWPPNIVHKDVWDLVGGYSIEFSPGMYSDPDFSMKLWQLGIKYFKGLSKSRVYHFGSVSVKRVKKNKGYHMFIIKWGITSSTFTNHYLKRGKEFNGLLKEPMLPLTVRLKNKVKRLMSSFISFE